MQAKISVSAKRIQTVMRAEFYHIFRDPLSLIIALVMPLQMLFLFGYTLSFELKEFPLAVFDMDRSQESRDYIKLVDNTSYFNVKYYPTQYRQVTNLLDRGTIRCAIIIPAGFSRRVKEHLPADIQTLVDGSEPNSAWFIINYLSALNAARSAEMKNAFFKSKGLSVNLEPISLASRSWYNQSLRDCTFTVTGAFSMSIMGFVPILCALAIVREKESGSIQQIFASPIHSYEYIAGKMSPYVIMLTLDFILVIIFGLYWFKLPFRGSYAILFMATFLMIFASVAVGFFISTLTKSQLTAMLLGIVFTLMPAFIFGDTIVPIEFSPDGLRIYSCIFPARFYSAICRAQIVKGSSIFSYWEDALSLVVYCIAIFSICVWRIKNKKI